MKIDLSTIPAEARKLTALGDDTALAIQRLCRTPELDLFRRQDSLDIAPLTEALMSGWSDSEAARLLNQLADAKGENKALDLKAVARWTRHHVDDPEAVQDCLRLLPPEEIEITKVLSRKGSQKLVFLATWKRTLRQVVLKQIRVGGETAEKIISRELQSSPFNIVHPNIIETHFLRNALGERFLIERRLTDVLSDDWTSKGIYEAANLLFDIALALKFLHQSELVHGDVKPDNIGKEGASYVLLDFGICRSKEEFTREASATGSLRTRAPELLVDAVYCEPEKVDVWALGATVFKAVVGRFPLVETSDKVPRVSAGDERKQFEETLRTRATTEWSRWVDTSKVPEPLREVLSAMLEKEPAKRISSDELINRADKALAAFLRSKPQFGEAGGRFSPVDEIDQLSGYLRGLRDDVSSIPRHKKQAIGARLQVLETYQGFDTQQIATLNKLRQVLM